MANFGIDAHAVGANLTGNETYVTNLVNAMVKLGTGHEFTVLYTHPKAALYWQGKQGLNLVRVRPEHPLVRIPLVMPWLVQRHNLDLLHVQYVGPPFLTAPLIVTIHDISFEYYPEFFSTREMLRFKATIPLTARRSSKILTISNNSKQALMDAYGIPDEKIVVTYLGVDTKFQPMRSTSEEHRAAAKYGINGRYLLAVGNLQPRKNMVRLIKAYTRLRNARPEIDHKLVIVGKKAWKFDPILSFIKSSRWVDDIILTDYVPDEDLRILYARAGLFVYPSIYEGFGLPPLEAMACGTPVVVSDRSSMPEVVGDAGIKVDPFDVDRLAAAMAGILLEPEVAKWYEERGLQRVKQFSWSKCASATMNIYEEISNLRKTQ